MSAQPATGLALVVLGGVLQGAFPLPLKWLRKQEWEHAWMVASAWGLVVLPWMIAAVSIPSIDRALAATSASVLGEVFLFGAGWGIGGLLFGLSVDRLGLSLTTGIALGMTSAVGSGVPLLLYHPEEAARRTGLLVGASLLVTAAGLAACTIAGRRRELMAEGAGGEQRNFWRKLGLCGLAGVLSPLFNFVIIRGEPLMQQAVRAGAHPGDAANLALAVGMTGGMLPTAAWCLYEIYRRSTWQRFLMREGRMDWVLTAVMGMFFAFGNTAYGMGAEHLGGLGAILGFPVFMAVQVLTGNLLGYASGEWRGAERRLVRLLIVGNLLLVLAIFLIGQASGNAN